MSPFVGQSHADRPLLYPETFFMKRSVFSFVFLLFVIQNYAQIPLNGLAAWYPFSGNLQDSSGNGNHALSSGNTYVADRFGNPGKAVYVGGNPDSIRFPVSGFTPMNGDFGISVWINSGFQRREHLFNLGDFSGATNDNFQVSLNNGVAAYVYWNGAGGNQLLAGQPSQICEGKWHHVAISRRNDTLRIWFDKQLRSIAYYNQPIGLNDAFVCGNSVFPYMGSIDDLAFYNSGLNDSLVSVLYHDQQPLQLLSPRSTDMYPLNTNCHIEWKAAATVSSLNLDYSIDGGMSWNTIATAVPANSLSYTWPMNFPFGTSVIVRIADAQNANIAVNSGAFGMSEYHWEMVNTQCAFSNRDGAGLLSFNGKLWLLGGWNPYDTTLLPGYTLNEVWSSVDGANWVLDTVAPWDPRHTSGWLVYDNKMWVIGGDGNSGYLINDVWSSTDGHTWIQVTDSLPMPARMTHMTAVRDNKMLVFGGQLIPGVGSPYDVVYDDVWESTDGANWTQICTNAPWSPRAQIEHYCVDSSQTIWMLGGGTYYDRHYYNDIWKSADGANWTKVMDNAPWPGRQYSEVAYFDNRLWVLDGWDGDDNRDDVWYSDDGTNWHELRNTPWPKRHAASVCEHDSSLWMVAGNLWNDSWRLRKMNIPAGVSPVQSLSANFTIAPNPGQNSITITSESAPGIIELLDITGRMLKTETSSALTSLIDISAFAPGVYYIRTNAGVKPFIKQ